MSQTDRHADFPAHILLMRIRTNVRTPPHVFLMGHQQRPHFFIKSLLLPSCPVWLLAIAVPCQLEPISGNLPRCEPC